MLPKVGEPIPVLAAVHTAGRAAAAAPAEEGETSGERGGLARHTGTGTPPSPLPRNHSDGSSRRANGGTLTAPPPLAGRASSCCARTHREGKETEQAGTRNAPARAGPLRPRHRLDLRPAVASVKWRPEAGPRPSFLRRSPRGPLGGAHGPGRAGRGRKGEARRRAHARCPPACGRGRGRL